MGGANSDSDVRSKVNDKTIGIDSIEKEKLQNSLEYKIFVNFI